MPNKDPTPLEFLEEYTDLKKTVENQTAHIARINSAIFELGESVHRLVEEAIARRNSIQSAPPSYYAPLTPPSMFSKNTGGYNELEDLIGG